MTDAQDKKRIEALELENVALRKRVSMLEGANSVLSKRILSAIQLITKGNTPISDKANEDREAFREFVKLSSIL